MQGLSIEESAAVLDVSTGTAKSRRLRLEVAQAAPVGGLSRLMLAEPELDQFSLRAAAAASRAAAGSPAEYSSRTRA